MKKYTIEDLSLMSGLSTRTIRNYQNLGILKGEKINNKWCFSEEECYDFFKNDMAKHSIEAKSFALVLDSFNIENNRVTNILYVNEKSVDKKLIMAKIKEYANFDFKMDSKTQEIRIIISADINTSINFLNFIQKLNNEKSTD